MSVAALKELRDDAIALTDLRGERSWIALIDSLRHLDTWLADILSRRERVMRSTTGTLFGSAGMSMVRECDVPAATWMVRLPVAELGSIRHESQWGSAAKCGVRVGEGRMRGSGRKMEV